MFTLMSDDSGRCDRHPHAGHQRPRVGVDLVPLDGVQAGGALPPPNGVDVAVKQGKAWK